MFRPRGFPPPRRFSPLPICSPEGLLPLMGFALRPASPAWRVATPGTLACLSCNEASSSEEHEVRCSRRPGCRPGRLVGPVSVGRTGVNRRTKLPAGVRGHPGRREGRSPHTSPVRRWERSAGKPARRTRARGFASWDRRASEETRTGPSGTAPGTHSGASGAHLRRAPACPAELEVEKACAPSAGHPGFPGCLAPPCHRFFKELVAL
jgi:hypothetical protein